MTPLDKSLKRALNIAGRDYVISLTPDALKVTEKGRRLGLELRWADIISGESALAVALRASLGKFQDDLQPIVRNRKERPRVRVSGKAASRARRLNTKDVAPKRSR